MNTHDEDEDGGDWAVWADWAALYVLDAVTSEERALCERRMRSDAAFRAEVERLRTTADQLLHAAGPVAPPSALFARVRERAGLAPTTPTKSKAGSFGAGSADSDSAGSDLVEGRSANETRDGRRIQPWKEWRAPASTQPLQYLSSNNGAFEPTAVPGVEVRKLHVDAAEDKVTMLVRMAAGSSYPAHRHGGPEECFVLSGDLEVGDELEMHSGDFQRAAVGSVHPVQSTRGGCLLLITSSLKDELLVLGPS
jgi:quercetin dioxygenase-like cupin family protein